MYAAALDGCHQTFHIKGKKIYLVFTFHIVKITSTVALCIRCGEKKHSSQVDNFSFRQILFEQ